MVREAAIEELGASCEKFAETFRTINSSVGRDYNQPPEIPNSNQEALQEAL